MTTHRLIAIASIRPGDELLLVNDFDDDPSQGRRIHVAHTRLGSQIGFKSTFYDEDNFTQFLVTTTAGAVLDYNVLVPIGDPAEGRFRKDRAWVGTYLVVEDDREALLQDIEEVRGGCPDYEDPDGQVVFYDATERVLAAALKTLGPGSAESVRRTTAPRE